MRSVVPKRLLQVVPLVFAVMLLLSDAKPAMAATCFQDLAVCYQDAASRGSWGEMWLAGLDCELTFAGCVADAIVR